MADKNRAAQIKKIMAADMAFTNVLAGILMILYESLWIVITYDSGRVALGTSFGWDIQLITVALIVLLTVPYLLCSLFLASSMADVARTIVGVCSVLIGLAALVFAGGFWVEAGAELKPVYAVTRLPWILFGLFVIYRLRQFKKRMERPE